MARKLLYSERKRLSEVGSLGPLSVDPTPGLINALDHLFTEGLGRGNQVGVRFRQAVYKVGFQYLEWSPGESLSSALMTAQGEQLLDLIEVVAGEAERQRHVRANTYWRAIPNAEQQINDLFDRHRFSFRLEEGEIRRIGSPALDEVVVGPALLAVRRAGWEQVEKSFREAIQHQRGGADENDDALTAANAALESALKAVGFKGDRLSTLAKSFRNSDHAPSELRGIPEALDTLLKRSSALRDNHGDAHGNPPGATPVPQGLVDLAIHWAGAFIVYLSETTS